MLFYTAVPNDAFFGSRIGPLNGAFSDHATDHEFARSQTRMPLRRARNRCQTTKLLKYHGKRPGSARLVCSAAM